MKIWVNLNNLWSFGLAVLLSCSLFSCGGRQNAEQSASPETSYDTARVLEMEVDATTSATRVNNQPTFNGVLVIPNQYHVTVTLFMDGVVKRAPLLSGAFVKKGELLAILENPEYITLQQSYIESHAQEEFLEAEYRRQEALAEGEAASKKTLQQSKADYLSMKSRREAAAAQLLLIGFNPAKILSDGIIPQLELYSPIDGYIANMQTNIGKYISAGDPVCDVIDKNKMLLKLTVYEKDINKLKMGEHLEFRVSGMENQLFNATIISLGQMVDNVSRSLEVYASVNGGDSQFRPGMYVSAQIEVKKNILYDL